MRDRPIGRALLIILGIFFISFIATLLLLFIVRIAPRPPTQPSVCVAPPRGSSTPATSSPTPSGSPPQTTNEREAAPALFIYSFNAPGVLQEASRMEESTSPYWFLDSGGKFITGDGVGATVQGSLSKDDRWYGAYARSNPLDTDGGAHPQNIFRLTSKDTWGNVSEEVWFRIIADNFSKSPNRNQSNGLLLMTRYCDPDNLYYAGIRVDGTAVIKKKYAGIYYTMAQDPFFAGTYDPRSNPNLLPHETWLGLRSTTETRPDGSVLVRLYVKRSENTAWELAVSAQDRGQFDATPPLVEKGVVGIRTDFMDVEFKNIRVESLQ